MSGLQLRAGAPILDRGEHEMTERLQVSAVTAREPQVSALLTRLTAELASAGYQAEQTFGYTAAQLEASGVHLVAARLEGDEISGDMVGVGGIELQGGKVAELKRFYVEPEHRGSGVAAAILEALVAYARSHGVFTVRLETGDRQHAAIAFYRRQGFVPIPRFGPYVRSATSVCMQRTIP